MATGHPPRRTVGVTPVVHETGTSKSAESGYQKGQPAASALSRNVCAFAPSISSPTMLMGGLDMEKYCHFSSSFLLHINLDYSIFASLSRPILRDRRRNQIDGVNGVDVF